MLIEADADVEIEFKDTIPKVVMRGFARQSKLLVNVRPGGGVA